MLKANCLMLSLKLSIKTHFTPSKPISLGAAPLLLHVLEVFIPSVVSRDQSLDQSDCSILVTWSEALPYMGIKYTKNRSKGQIYLYTTNSIIYLSIYVDVRGSFSTVKLIFWKNSWMLMLFKSSLLRSTASFT